MMMLRGDDHPTVQIPPWDFRHVDDPTALTFSYEELLAALHRFLPANKDDVLSTPGDEYSDEFDFQADAFSGDDFRMFEFKVKKCAVVRSHDWTACPFAHPGEKARRRDPRKYHYSGSACPDFRKAGACVRGDACECAHGVFESWLHPARYRTQPCKDGTHCRRRVCFFAHTPEQLRVLPYAESSPSLLGQESFVSTSNLLNFSPKSTLYYPPSLSPAIMSPPVSPSVNSVDQLSESVRLLQLRGTSLSPRPQSIRVGSPQSPSAPLSSQGRPRLGSFDAWGISGDEEPLMERVESGRELRERIYAKLGKENSLVSGPRWAG